MGKDDVVDNIGGSFLLLLTITVAFASAIYFLITGLNSKNITILSVGVIIFSILVAGITLYSLNQKKTKEIIKFSRFSSSSFGFFVGFSIYVIINSLQRGSFSVLAIPQNTLYSSISSELPQVTDFLSGVFLIPVVEEIFWGLGLALAIYGVLSIAGKKYKIANNPYFQFFVIFMIGSISFALFHTAKQNIIFIISAMLFRSIMYAFIVADQKVDWLKNISVPFMFTIGAHIGNNWSFYGLTKGFNLLIQEISNGMVIVFLVYLAIIFVGVIDFIGKLLIGDKESTK